MTTSRVRGDSRRDSLVQLHQLPAAARLGILAITAVLGGGFLSSGWYLYYHYEKRDEKPGLTIDDIKAAYHGLETQAPLKTARERGHPEGLPEESRKVLLSWLESGQVFENYDNIDFADVTPKEILTSSCISCHARSPKDAKGAFPSMPLENWDDVKAVSASKKLNPYPINILALSTHTHALAIGTMAAVIVLMTGMTRWPRGLVGFLSLVAGVGLFVDIGSWWVTRHFVEAAWGIVVGGAMFNMASGLLLVMIALGCLRPGPRVVIAKNEVKS